MVYNWFPNNYLGGSGEREGGGRTIIIIRIMESKSFGNDFPNNHFQMIFKWLFERLWGWVGGRTIIIIRIMESKSFGNDYSNNHFQMIYKWLFERLRGWGGRTIIIIIRIMGSKWFGNDYSNNHVQMISKWLFERLRGWGGRTIIIIIIIINLWQGLRGWLAVPAGSGGSLSRLESSLVGPLKGTTPRHPRVTKKKKVLTTNIGYSTNKTGSIFFLSLSFFF